MAQHIQLLGLLEKRFHQHMHRHPQLDWSEVADRLKESHLDILQEMEQSGGEPDVVGFSPDSICFVDCATESPKGRRSLCYDQEARESRKDHSPKGSAQEMAATMGVKLLTEAEYRALQTFEPFDLKTSSWVVTPPEIRSLGGALFCDRRYDTVFLYHNGADSYYAARGFRGSLKV